MLRGNLRMMVVAACLVSGLIFNNLAAEDPPSAPKSIEGLWSGPWGGGERNGVVLQPVMAELSIKGRMIQKSLEKEMFCLLALDYLMNQMLIF